MASPARTPLHLPDAVTLVPHAAPDALVNRIDTTAAASVKDGFADLDFAGAHFRILFKTPWIPPGKRDHHRARCRGGRDAYNERTPRLGARVGQRS
ncbi:hypothetical protein ACH3VS_39520 [Streptomyces sp. WSLK1-3]|uniref:hypothetical protein n=1 Tax=Streptomyces sp. WSLK1-3 TaxID=3375475 RepID=UPI0037886580